MPAFKKFNKDKRPKRNTQSLLFKRKRFCRFTVAGVEEIDYKDVDVLKDFINENGDALWKDFGRAVALKSLEALRSIGGLRVGAVYRQATRETAPAARAAVYGQLLARFEHELKQSDSLAMVFMDGDGSDASYRDAHCDLPRKTRRVIDDPIYTDSRTSQLMQMADHVAWCANAAVTRAPKYVFDHVWYERFLAVRDPTENPWRSSSP